MRDLYQGLRMIFGGLEYRSLPFSNSNLPQSCFVFFLMNKGYKRKSINLSL